ncbi:MAG: hypothetical protein CMK59_02790 [Proteobacteria bacterium]|nr:hypothetical protein [Pseudomonadota bacterium]
MAANQVAELIHRASPTKLEVVSKLLQSIGEDPEGEGTDLMSLSRDVLAALYHAATGRLMLASDEEVARLWTEYKRSLTPHFLGDVEWIRHRRGYPSPTLGPALSECRRNGWLVVDVAYVRPSRHFGKDVGDGLYSLIPLQVGQLLFQFSGSVHPFSAKYVSKNDMRQNYVIVMKYGSLKLIVNPLIDDDTRVCPTNFAAFINEPSPPVWKKGDVARDDTGKNVLVKRYSFRTGEYDVEYSNQDDRVLPASELMSHYPPEERKFEANVCWYNFPVPLNDLYSSTGRKRGEHYVFKRTGKKACLLTWSVAELGTHFQAFSDATGIYKFSKRISLQPGHMLYLKEDVFDGLENYGIVRSVGQTEITVSHSVLTDVLWRLPHTCLAAKAVRCPECRRDDDATCKMCTFVPFPVVYACRDIRPGEEFLCLYAKPTPSRGLPCRHILRDEAMKPRWDDHY